MVENSANGGNPMKRYLTSIFICFSFISLIVGFRLNVTWNGVVSWGLALIFLLFAAYFTRYIPNEENKKRSHENN